MSENQKAVGTCRSCLMETSELRSIFKPGKICGEITKLADMLETCTKMQVIYCTRDCIEYSNIKFNNIVVNNT